MKLRDDPPKRFAFWRGAFVKLMVTALVTLVLLEVGAFPVYRLVFHKPLSRAEIQNRLGIEPPVSTEPVPGAPGRLDFKNHILHPYLGFVARPGTYTDDREFCRIDKTVMINAQGFPGPDPLAKAPTNAVNVCVLGGSFALNFYLDSGATLSAELKKRDAFKDKQINILSLAVSGWKQPQQLLGLEYLLAQGAHFDVVVNLDGFNEIALPSCDNMPDRIYTFYPRKWRTYASRTILPDPVLQKLSELAALKEQARWQRRWFAARPFRDSNFCLLMYAILDRRAGNQINEANAQLAVLAKAEARAPTFETSGPASPREIFENWDALLTYLVDFWETCSRQMDALCRANHIVYLHFLQPNQYVPDSKTMGPAERKVAWLEGNGFKTVVEHGYPWLRQSGQHLQAAGINFVDLTLVYQNVAEAVYEDNSCHVNQRGNDLVASAIAEKIAAVYPRPLSGR